MPGRRAAVAVSTLAVAAFGSGVALAATHSGSKSQSRHPMPSQQARPSQSAPRMSGHDCPNMGSSPSSTAATSL